jgi:hypothetical protein
VLLDFLKIQKLEKDKAMKIINSKSKTKSDWTDKIMNESFEKFASLNINSGKIKCPINNSLISTSNCELCEYCKGINLKIASSNEVVICEYDYKNNKEIEASNPVEKFATSNNKPDIDLSEDGTFGSIFKRDRLLQEEANEEDLASTGKIVSAKNVGMQGVDGTSLFISEKNNSIFSPDNLEKLEKLISKEKEVKVSERKKDLENKESRKKEWEVDKEKELSTIEHFAQTLIKPISHEIGNHNQKIGDYSFSTFENIDKKLSSIEELTEGEKLKDKKAERKESISRAAKKDNWEEDSNKTTSTSKIFDELCKTLLGE